MLMQECRRGMKVIFGRRNGEQTPGIVVKMNPTTAKVQILQDRGSASPAGQIWKVPYSMMRPADPVKVTVVGVQPNPPASIPALPPAPPLTNEELDDVQMTVLVEQLVNDGVQALTENHEESIRNLVPSMPPTREEAAAYAYEYGLAEMIERLKEKLVERYPGITKLTPVV